MTPTTEAGKRLLDILGVQARHVGLPPELTEDFPARIAAIEAEAVASEAHRAELLTTDLHAENERLRMALAEIARLRRALYFMRTYARHDRLCVYAPTYPDAPVATCDCGFDQTLAEYAAVRAPQEDSDGTL